MEKDEMIKSIDDIRKAAKKKKSKPEKQISSWDGLLEKIDQVCEVEGLTDIEKLEVIGNSVNQWRYRLEDARRKKRKL